MFKSFALSLYWLFIFILEEDNSDDEEVNHREKRFHSEVHSINVSKKQHLKQHLIIIHILRSCRSLINNYFTSACWIRDGR